MNRLRALAAAALALGLIAAGAPALASAVPATSSDPLGCAADVFDPAGVLDARVVSAISQAERSLGAEIRVRAERSVDGGLEARLDQLVRQCDGWAAADGELADEMVVVMFSEAEREASVYYGADLGPDLEHRWSDAVDEMTAEFPSDYSGGVVAALRTLRTEQFDDASSASSTSTASTGSGSAVMALLVIGGLIVAGIVAHLRRRSEDGGSWGTLGFTGSGRSWASGSSRRRRSSAGRFSSRSRSRSSSSRRSSRGSRRAGGGTKKW